MLFILSQNLVHFSLLQSSLQCIPMYSWQRKKNYCGKGHAARTHIVTTETDQTLHMQATTWQNFSKKKAAKARAQRLSPVGRMTWWKKGRKWRCHNNAQWQNDTQEKKHNGTKRTKYNSTTRDNTSKAKLSSIFTKALVFSSGYFLTLLHKFMFCFQDECFRQLH